MAKHVRSDGGGGAVVVDNVCPGTCDTRADDNLPFYLRIPMNLNRRLRARSAEDGARALVFAATGVGREDSGAYLADGVVSRCVHIMS